MTDGSSIRALVFDVFGTVVDWRGSIIDEGQELSRTAGLSVDWPRFADRWREMYGPSMDRVRRGEIPWRNLDALHRASLDELLVEFGVSALSEEQKAHLNCVWHRLRPWPEVVPAMQRLRSRFILGTLSNGNVSLLVNMAKHAGLPWDCVLSAELVHAYKPDAAVYQLAVDLLAEAPGEVMMVAAHQGDLRAAAKVGLRTAFVPRPLEWGPERKLDTSPDPAFDIVASGFDELAVALGV